MIERGLALDASELARSFFLRIPGTDTSPISYFEKTFVEPTGLEQMIAQMTPSSPPRLLPWDGQSRIGKTWSAIGVIRTLFQRHDIDAVWTSGEDSCLVYDADHTWSGRTLLAAFREVERRVKDLIERGALHGRVIILLDDFIGTARLRTMPTSPRELTALATYFADDPAKNPLLRVVAKLPAATVVVTGRSSVFTSARIRLGLPFEVKDRVSRGVFQTIDGRFVGTVDGDWLGNVLDCHSSFISSQPEFLLPPVAAFAANAPRTLTDEPQIARILFGGDLAEFADEIEAAETRRAGQVLDKMDDVYLLYVAPALMFPERATEWLWASGVASLRQALFLHPGAEGAHLRVPNKFYLRAVTIHLSDKSRLEVLSRVLQRRISKIPDERHRSVLLRGFLERLLDWRKEPTPDLAAAVTALVPDTTDQDPLLRWEKEAVLRVRGRRPIDAETVLANPGLASAVGWATLKFPALQTGNLGKDFIKDVADQIRKASETEQPSSPQNDPRVIAVSYSNLLRWFTYDVDTRGNPRAFERLGGDGSPASHRSYKQPATSDLMQMVFEDVIVWADGLEDGTMPIHVEKVRVAGALLKSMRADVATLSRPNPEDYAAWQIANRLFSLTWHGEWMDKEDSYYRQTAVSWLDRFLQVGLDLVAECPGLLSVNLQYHWHHMLAQWAVWTRDWCFASDTEAFERSRHLSFTTANESSRAIRSLLATMLQQCDDARDARNAFFLLGSRAAPADNASPLLDAMSRFSDAAKENNLWQGCLQGIYELARQGFLDPPMPPTMGERPSVHSPAANGKFRDTCRAFFRRHHNKETWNEYLSDLCAVTHLDVIPSTPNDILPAEWAAEVQSAAPKPYVSSAPKPGFASA